MALFRPFLSPKVRFKWDDELQRAFEKGKKDIIDAIEDGVHIFDPNLRTCVRTDWSKEGMGYYLSQKLQVLGPQLLHGGLAHLPGSLQVQLRRREQICAHRRRGAGGSVGAGTEQVLHAGLRQPGGRDGPQAVGGAAHGPPP